MELKILSADWHAEISDILRGEVVSFRIWELSIKNPSLDFRSQVINGNILLRLEEDLFYTEDYSSDGVCVGEVGFSVPKGTMLTLRVDSVIFDSEDEIWLDIESNELMSEILI